MTSISPFDVNSAPFFKMEAHPAKKAVA